MPELPEVETIRRDLQAVLPGKKIARLEIRKRKLVRGSPAKLTRLLTGRHIKNIGRRAKLLIIFFHDTNHAVLLHLKMTGQLLYENKKGIIAGGHSFPPVPKELPNKYSHFIIHFTDGNTLYFNDLRQFGYVQLVTADELGVVLHTYGLEPLTPAFTLPAFREALRTRSSALKQVLLNQAVVAGLGNIYVDEVCFAAGVRPSRSVARLSVSEMTKLYRACQRIMRQAIKYRGTTFSDYRDPHGRHGSYYSRLKVYGRAKQPCRRCRTPLVRRTVAGRGTVYCPHCQT